MLLLLTAYLAAAVLLVLAAVVSVLALIQARPVAVLETNRVAVLSLLTVCPVAAALILFLSEIHLVVTALPLPFQTEHSAAW